MSAEKTVKYDDQAVAYGLQIPQTLEVASGKIVCNAGVLSGFGVKGVASYQFNAGSLEVFFDQSNPNPYQTFLQFASGIGATLLVRTINESAGGFKVTCHDPADAPVDLSANSWILNFSVRNPV